MGKTGIHIDYSAFSDLIAELDDLGKNIADIVAESMEEAGKTLGEETVEAVADANLPAQGDWSSKAKKTKNAVVTDPKAENFGSYVEIGLGFDKSKGGAGGLLITGTPKMQPDSALEAIYKTRKYETKMKKQIKKKLEEELSEKLGG